MDPASKLEEYQGSLDSETVKQKLREHWHAPALLAVFLLAFTLRYMPANGMKYLQAVDPYFIFRNAQHLALEGTLPQIDFHRYFPYTSPTYLYNNGDFIIPALLYNAGFGLFFENFLEWAQFYPAMLGAGSVGVMYFLGKELFNKNTGLAAAFFLAVTTGALRRTSAGFFEKEPIGTFLMMTSLLFFTRAWKQESWKNGILSGLSLGLFTISWGGADMLWLLYPIVTGAVVFINEDIRALIAAYTPTVLVGGFFGAILNPTRFGLTGNLFVASIGVLGLLWARYLVEEFGLVDDDMLEYFTPSLALLGGVGALFLSFFSDFIASKIIGVFRKALQSGSGVIGGTVQENAPPGASSLVRNIGSGIFGNLETIDLLGQTWRLGRINEAVEFIGMFVSPWTLMMFGVPFMAASLIFMLGRKYSVLPESIPGKKHTAYIQMIFVAWLVFISALVQNFVFIGAFAALVIGASLFTLIYFLDEESSLTISTLMMAGAFVGTAIYAVRFGGISSATAQLVMYPALLALIGSAAITFFQKDDGFEKFEIELNWYTALPLIWVVSNVFGGTTRSRLVFLSTFSIALAAGYGFSKAVERLQTLDYSEVEMFDPEVFRRGLTAFILILTLGSTLASGFIMAQGMGGSPSPSPQVWEPSLDFMRDDTEEGSVILSWWDYGYYFETLGQRAAVADGMNAGYYSDETRAVNMPLANYLNATATNPNNTEFLQKHSVDYIWLDYTMIGKFSAVSQIANRDNSEFTSMRRMGTVGSVSNSMSSDGNETLVRFRGRLGRGVADIFAPVESTNTSMELSGAPTVRLSNGRTTEIDCVLTEDGKQTYNTSSDIGFCLAEDPFYSLERGLAAQSNARAVLVPKKISDSTFVRLYIQDGWGVDYAEKVPEASNGYIKMWEVDTNQTRQ